MFRYDWFKQNDGQGEVVPQTDSAVGVFGMLKPRVAEKSAIDVSSRRKRDDECVVSEKFHRDRTVT